MKTTDTDLIHRILDGDNTAFTELVEKYQKPVHALVWRKIGDFHIAEDITQDIFLKVYQELKSLKKPHSFASWLYVIAANNCSTWLRNKRPVPESFEDTDTTQLDKPTYSGYVISENERIAVESQRDAVKKLLAKLQESERTVITLHYFGGMSSAEIGAFLGVSANTVRSRLRRAQQRLKKEEAMIREALEHFQISPNITDNIMREVSRLKPTPSSSKPTIPWTVAASTAVLIVLMLAIGSQRLARFQKPYSLEAQSEMSVEITEALIVPIQETEPDVRQQFGNTNTVGKNDTPSQDPDDVLLVAAETEGEEEVSLPKQWIPGKVPGISADVRTILPTTDRSVYILDYNEDLYKTAIDGSEWEQVSDLRPFLHDAVDKIPIVEFNDTLYIILFNEIFASTDGGETWNSVGECPKGIIVDLTVLEGVFYLALEYGVFSSKDSGQTWIPINEGLIGEINSLETLQNTLFLRTTTGIYSTRLYRFKVDRWQPVQYPVAETTDIRSFTGTDNMLYIIAVLNEVEFNKNDIGQIWWLYRSNDNGNSWTEITPKNAESIFGNVPFENEPLASLVAKKNTVLIIGWDSGSVIRSIDKGNTWTLVDSTGISAIHGSVHDAVALNDSTFYIYGESGIYRSFDAGMSWSRYNTQPNSGLYNLTFVKKSKEKNTSGTLYAMTREEVFKSSDKGKSWRVVNADRQNKGSYLGIPTFSQIVESGGMLYGKCQTTFIPEVVTLHKISDTRKTLIPIQGMPVFDSRNLYELLQKQEIIQPGEGPLALAKMFVKGSDQSYIEQLQKSSVGATQFFKQLAVSHRGQSDSLRIRGLQGAFAVSNDIFYLEYNFKLFRWEPGDTEWYDTGQEETVMFSRDLLKKDLKLAALGNTVYVGKRDGKLMASFDKGTNWIDFTSALPFPVNDYKQILVAGTTVYVATDAGVVTSEKGKNWRAISDADGISPIMEHLAADGKTLYGHIKATGIYRLESGTWKQIISEIPEDITSMAVDGKTLYVVTETQGMLHYILE